MKKVVFIIVAFFASFDIMASVPYSESGLPVVGAQIFIEPGQTEEQVESWFVSLESNGMKVCRMRLFESYVHQPDGNWDYTLFDRAMDLAYAHGISVYLTLFPNAVNGNLLGGFKFPADDGHLQRITEYISNCVLHYRNHPALCGWVLLNEPGTGGYIPSTPFSKRIFSEWKESREESSYNSGGYVVSGFEKEEFLTYFNSWYINWLADTIRKIDESHFLHVNNHNIFDNVAEYDFPSWRDALSSLGASCHPSWHFKYFDRKDYTTAMAANFNIVRSGAGKLPFIITEMQGGNNTFSGYSPFCPTRDEITQWLWTALGSGAKGVIFWCFNPRSAGEEAGEWALINYRGGNSDRLDAVKEVCASIDRNKDVLENAYPLDSHVSIIYNRESLWTERKLQQSSSNPDAVEGRCKGSVIKSAIGMFEALMSVGINPSFGEWREYDWSKDNYKGETIVLANLIALPSYQWADLRNFVSKGGKLIAEGLTAFFDENTLAMNHTGFPLEDVFGTSLLEVKANQGDFEVEGIPAHLWHGILETGNFRKHTFGDGEVLWMPSLFALGARRIGNYAPLVTFLRSMLPEQPLNFKESYEDIVCSYLQTGKGIVSVICNKAKEVRNVRFSAGRLHPELLYADKGGLLRKDGVRAEAGETLVLLWK